MKKVGSLEAFLQGFKKENRKASFNWIGQNLSNLENFFKIPSIIPKIAVAGLGLFSLFGGGMKIIAQENPAPTYAENMKIEETLPWDLLKLWAINGKTNENDYQVYIQMNNDIDKKLENLISQEEISPKDGWNKSEIIKFGNEITPIFEEYKLFYKKTSVMNECVDEERDKDGNIMVDKNGKPIQKRKRNCDTGVYYWVGFLERYGIEANAIYIFREEDNSHCFLEIIPDQGETFYWETTWEQSLVNWGIDSEDLTFISNGVRTKEQMKQKYPGEWIRANRETILKYNEEWLKTQIIEEKIIKKTIEEINEKGELETITKDNILNYFHTDNTHRLKAYILSNCGEELQNQGNSYRKNNLEKALVYYEKSFELSNNSFTLCVNYLNLAHDYLFKEIDPEKAIELFDKVDKINEGGIFTYPGRNYNNQDLMKLAKIMQKYKEENPEAGRKEIIDFLQTKK